MNAFITTLVLAVLAAPVVLDVADALPNGHLTSASS